MEIIHTKYNANGSYPRNIIILGMVQHSNSVNAIHNINKLKMKTLSSQQKKQNIL